LNLHILGTRGLPAKHGGFETFAEQLALYLVARDHEVTVYCQSGPGKSDSIDTWHGIRRVTFSEEDGPQGTVRFDLRSALAASRDRTATILTLGYNTAIFSLIHTLRGSQHYMNMDGIEWKRQKWSRPARLWLRLNEWFGAKLSTGMIADHPEIKAHLNRHGRADDTTVIPYGADAITEADVSLLDQFGIKPHEYFLVIARPEPENSILDIVKAFASKPRTQKLVVLGAYLANENPYHGEVLEAGMGDSVIFPGAIYDSATVTALRFYASAYIHGHQVGGTNPSLVEALAAANPIVAHDNIFNRWVAGDSARYFNSVENLSALFDELEADPGGLRAMQDGSRERHKACFQRETILHAYEQLLKGIPLKEAAWMMQKSVRRTEAVSLSKG
jgi:glycosyltransferase involved in cell wall biosynthesis